MNAISIRNAVREEWPTVLAIHYRAIHEIASTDYPEEILNAWGTPVGQPDFTKFDEKLKHGQVIIVAEIEGMLVGFGELIPDKNELLAVYVNPDYVRQGVGTAILHELENIARKKQLPFLQMAASLTAVPFYEDNGYSSVERDAYTLQTGVSMDCVRMRKELT